MQTSNIANRGMFLLSAHLRALLLCIAIVFVVPLAVLAAMQPKLLQFSLPDLSQLGQPPARAEVMSAWERARVSGQYRFEADVVQTNIPLPTLSNLGRTSRDDTYHIEGTTNLAQRHLELAMWQGGGSVADPATATSVKVEGDQAFARKGGETWQSIPDFTASVAPSGDFLAYLSAAKNIVKQGQEERAGIQYTRYTFDLDGMGFAIFMRDMIEAQMKKQGKLPYGLNLGLAEQYKDMSGTGELWVRPDGLPLRQIINADFPPESDFKVHAQVTVNFSNYANLDTAQSPFAGVYAGLVPLLANLRNLSTSGFPVQFVLLACILAACALFAKHFNSRRVYNAIVLFVIVSMLLSPLLQTQQAYAYTQQAISDNAAQQAKDALQNQVREVIQQVQEANKFDPSTNPLVNAQQEAASESAAVMPPPILPTGGDAAQIAAPPQANPDAQNFAPFVVSCGDTSDGDGDGLRACDEALLGTDENRVDTDGDGRNDNAEVTGIAFNNKTWYSDPTKASSLDDTIPDGLKCSNGNCAIDTDSDGTPDIADRDLDGDGVPNQIDLSPFRANATTFSQAAPFSYVINGLQTGKPTYVEFQLRPISLTHLTYAYNVLDWAKDDHQGQLQRDFNTTFAGLCQSNCQAADNNGNIRLVPMLEIRVPGGTTNLPSAEELQTFGGISRRDVETAINPARTVYVPLQVVNEPNTQGPVAFYGKMLYRPGANWGGAQQVRLAWLVEMITDQCQESDGATCKSYVKDGKDYHNQVQTIYTYYDDFKLTAFNVREDNGIAYALAYEDPAADTDLNDDFSLTALAGGLDHNFLTGRDCDSFIDGKCVSDGAPDLTVNGRKGGPTIASRFDHTQNGSVPEVQRWSIPNDLKVLNRTYEHRDQALATIAMTDTRTILNQFTSRWSASSPITPSILFAREESFRSANLSQQGSGSTVQWSGNQLTVDFNADGGTAVSTIAGLSIAPYKYNGVSWQAMNIPDYWAELDRRMALAREVGDAQDIADGKAAIVQLYYTALYGGVDNIVQLGNAAIPPKVKFSDDAKEDATIKKVITQGKLGTKLLVNLLVNKFVVKLTDVYKYLGTLKGTKVGQLKAANAGLKDLLKKFVNAFKSTKSFLDNLGFLAFTTATILVALVGAGLFAYGMLQDKPDLALAGAILLGTALFVISLVIPVYKITLLVTETGLAVTKILGASTELIGTTRVAGAVGLVLQIGIIWGIFIYQVLHDHLEPGSIAYNSLAVGAAVGTVIAIFLVVLGLLNIAAAIIVAILAFVDAVLSLVCLANHTQNCFTLTGSLAEVITKGWHSGDSSLDTEHKDDDGNSDMVVMDSINQSIGDPNLGFVEGNTLVYKAHITTNIYQKEPESGIIWSYANDKFFGEEDLRAAAFNYKLGNSDNDYPPAANANAQFYDWGNVGIYKSAHTWNFLKGNLGSSLTSATITLKPGLNQHMPVYFNLQYAVPGFECWLWVCTSKNITGKSSSNLSDNFVYDVLPAKLDDFVHMQWDSSLPKQRDDDGDGLVSTDFGGNDPNDHTFDADNDGVPDMTEVTQGIKSNTSDSDNDGISDHDELVLGTNPNQRDSDDDGLTDAQEIAGWDFNYDTVHSYHVTSDPGIPDTDGDGIDDISEKTLKSNPRAETVSPLTLDMSLTPSTVYLKGGASATFTSNLTDNVVQDDFGIYVPVSVQGTMSTALPAVFGGQTTTTNFVLGTSDSKNFVTTLNVPSNASSGQVVINNTINSTIYGQYPGNPRNLGAYNFVKSFTITIDNDKPSAATTSTVVRPGAVNIIGGTASDPTSYITGVEVNIDGSGFVQAEVSQCARQDKAACAWTFAWNVPAGSVGHSIQVRATDVVGNTTSPASSANIYVDDTAPSAASGLAANPTVAGDKGLGNHWVVPLKGTATDPGSGATASGIDSVQVRMAPNGQDWTDATITPNGSGATWTLNYSLSLVDGSSAPLINPTGQYTYSVRAIDKVGNATSPGAYANGSIRLDNTAPNLTLQIPSAPGGDLTALRQITEPMTIGGTVTDPAPINSGIASAELSFTWDKVTDVYSRTIMALAFDDPAGTTTFNDSTGQGNAMLCDAAAQQCPTAGGAGRFGKATSWGGAQVGHVFNVPVPAAGYSFVGWFNTTCATCGIFAVDKSGGSHVFDRQIYLSGGNICADVVNGTRESICSANVNYADGNWHMVAQTVGSSKHQLYVDGLPVANGIQTASASASPADLYVGRAPQFSNGSYTGKLDEFKLFNVELSADTVRGMFQSWQPVTLGSSGAGVTNTTWNTLLPTGLEGNYNIDLTATDTLGNRNDDRADWSHWHGEIDTAAPRLTLTASFIGYFAFSQTIITASAEDLNLDANSLTMPCYDPRIVSGPVTRSYNTLTRPGEPQRLNKVTATCTLNGFQTTGLNVRACDTVGHCASKAYPEYRVYVSSTAGGIYRAAAADGSSIQTLVPAATANATGGIALDKNANKMYWVSGSTIKRANIDGTNVTTILTGLNAPNRLVISTASGKLYWSEPTLIRRANLDGSGAQTLLTRTDTIVGLQLDPPNGYLYWLEDNATKLNIFRSSLDGSGVSLYSATDTFNGVRHAKDLAVDAQGNIAMSFYEDCVQISPVYRPTKGCIWNPSKPPGTVEVQTKIQANSAHVPLAYNGAPADAFTVMGVDDGGSLYLGRAGGGLYSVSTGLTASITDPRSPNAPQLLSGDIKGVAFGFVDPGVTSTADLTISKSATPTIVSANNALTYTLTVHNVGATVATGVVVTDTLPANTSFVSSTPSCSTLPGNVIQCALAPLAVGATTNVVVQVTTGASVVGSIANNASVGSNSPDSNSSNNSTVNIVTGLTPTPSPTATSTARALLSATPIPPGRAKSLIWNDPDKLRVYRLSDGYSYEFPAANSCPQGVGIDSTHDTVYWTQCDGTIHRANFDGTNPATIIQGQSGPTGIVIDGVRGKIYWKSYGKIYDLNNPPRLSMANLDGTNIVTLATATFPDEGLALDTVGNQLLWSQDESSIRRAELDGSNPNDLAGINNHNSMWSAGGIALDGVARKLYWTDDRDIKRGDLLPNSSGVQNKETVATTNGLIVGLVVDAPTNTLYFSNNFGQIQSVNLATLPATPVELVPFRGTYGDRQIALGFFPNAAVPTATASLTPTRTNTPTVTNTPTRTNTPSPTPTRTNTPTVTPTPCESTGSIVGKVFNDANQNATDDSEPGVAGVTINLDTSGGTFITSTTTASDGSFQFTNLAFGQYLVVEQLPGGATATTPLLVGPVVGMCFPASVTFGNYFAPTATPTQTNTRLPGTATPSGNAKHIFYASGDATINAAQTDGSNFREIYSQSTHPRSVAYNSSDNKIYWTETTDDFNNGRIMRSDLNGSNVEVVLGAQLNPLGLVIDPTGNGILYFRTDSCTCGSNTTSILRYDRNSSSVAPIVTGIDATGESGLALDTEANKIYWSDFGGIHRADASNGANAETLVPSTDTNARVMGIALDTVHDKVYWTERISQLIQRANLDGSNVETVLTSTQQPQGIVLDVAGGKLYWSEFLSCICSADLTANATESTAISFGNGVAYAGLTLVYITIPTPTPTLTPSNTPTNTLTPTPTFTPSNTPTNTSTVTLTPTATSTYTRVPGTSTPDGAHNAKNIYYARINYTFNPDLGEIVIVPADNIGNAVGTGAGFQQGYTDSGTLAVDQVHNWLYWVDRGNNQIDRKNLQGGSAEVVDGFLDPRAVVVDPTTQIIYVRLCVPTCEILAYDTTTNTAGAVLVSSTDGTQSLAFDSERNRLYWGETASGTSTIKWIDPASPATQHTVITTTNGPINGIYIDGPNDYIYYTEGTSHNIQRADLTGVNQNIVTISTGLPDGGSDDGTPLGLVLDGSEGKVYWTQYSGLYYSNLTVGSTAIGLIGNNGNTTPSLGGGVAIGYIPIADTPTPVPTDTATPIPTITPTPSNTPSPTATPTTVISPFVVQTNGDGPIAACSGLSCQTLRDAIDAANNNPGANAITFAGGVVGTITLTQGLLEINDDVTITGPGAGTLAVSGNNASQVLWITGGTVAISGLTIRDGNVTGSGGGISAIFGSNVTLTNVVVSNNTATVLGGGINADATTFTMTGGSIHDNVINGDGASAAFGGGISSGRSLMLNNVAIYQNTIYPNGSQGRGAGIYNSGTTAATLTNILVYSNTVTAGGLAPSGGGGLYAQRTMNISASAFFSNTVSDGDGGGIVFNPLGEGGSTALNLVNSTISGNTTTGNGGGIFADHLNVRLNNITIANNTANGDGGGIAVSNPTVGITNTLVAGNLSGGAPDCALTGATVTNGGYNLIGDTTGCSWTSTTGDVTNPATVNIGPLADNGGSTFTHKLLTSPSNSPAIDAGNPGGCTDRLGNTLTTDQRGLTRPQGAACDIGAFERQPGDTGMLLPYDAFIKPVVERMPFRPLANNPALAAYVAAMNGLRQVAHVSAVPGTETKQTDVQALPNAVGTIYTVNKTDDHNDGTCNGSDCTLREAVNAANANAGADTIQFDPAVTGLVLLTQGELAFTDDVIVNGPGSSILTVGAGGASRVVNINGANVDLTGLTVSNGSASSGAGIQIAAGSSLNGTDLNVHDNAATQQGAGILNLGTLTLNQSALFNNTVVSGGTDIQGAGIFNNGVINLTNVQVYGNTLIANANTAAGAGIYNNAGGSGTLDTVQLFANLIPNSTQTSSGGGLYQKGSLTLLHTLVTLNSVGNGSGGGIENNNATGALELDSSQIISNTVSADGAGLHVVSSSGVTIAASTLSNNNAAGSGGALAIQDSSVNVSGSTFEANHAGADGAAVYLKGGSVASIVNSTLADGTAQGSGGGIHADGGTLTLNNDTLVHNTADSDNNNSGNGGGIAATALTLQIGNTLVALNSDASGNAPDCELDSILVTNNGYNLIGDTTGCSWSNGTGDVVNPADALNLGDLQDNGGTTESFAPFAGSPVLDAGNDATCETTDQRGLSRPFDGNNDGTASCDIGAIEANIPPVVLQAPLNYVPPVLDSGVLTPTNGALFDGLNSIDVAGGAYASDFLKSLEVKVNGGTIDTFNWNNGDTTSRLWATQWTPPAAGTYVLESVATDWASRVQTDTHPITITVQPDLPTIQITSNVVTTVDQNAPTFIDITGTASGTGTPIVEIQTEAGGAYSPAQFDGTHWHYALQFGDPMNPPDGTTIHIKARITDGLARIETDTKDIVVDLAPPSPVNITLSYDDGSVQSLVTGQTIHAAAPTLIADWSASSDGSGLDNYLVGWSTDPTPNLGTLTAQSGRHLEAVAGEAQPYYATIVSQDIYGNQTVQTVGPVFVDAPTTPDLITDLHYHDWMNSGASLISSDHAVSDTVPGAALQNFYTSWDGSALRMAWTGANWNSDGALYIYLDTQGGGASNVYDPYGGSGNIQLPAGFGADYMIWVQDSASAMLYHRSGGGWAPDENLGAANFALDTVVNPSVTDVYLPFSKIGVSAGASIKVLALASEEGALQFWASAPDQNPLNSPRVTSPLAKHRDLSNYRLTQFYTIAALSGGQTPNSGLNPGADLHFSVDSAPGGVSVGFLRDNLFDVVTPGTQLDADANGIPDASLPFNMPPAVVDGQQITYNVRYENVGTATAYNVKVKVTAHGALRLSGNQTTATFNLGDVTPGTSTTLPIAGTISSAANGSSAEMDAVVQDAQHGDFDYLWVQHPVDSVAPQNVAVTAPEQFVKPGVNEISGTATDASGVSSIALEITELPSNAVANVNCTDPTPNDGNWTCNWDAGNLSGANQVKVRARATDGSGLQSGYSAVKTLVADTTPPTVTLDATVDQFLTDGYLNAAELQWSGQVTDNRAATALVVCADGTFSLDCPNGATFDNATSANWKYDMSQIVAGDGISRTVNLYGVDALANPSNPGVSRTFTLDTVAPVITVTQEITNQVTIADTTPDTEGLANTANLANTAAASLIQGTVSDGSGIKSMSALILEPEGTFDTDVVTFDDTNWSYTPAADLPADVMILISAQDNAGNISSVGPFGNGGEHEVVLYVPLVGRKFVTSEQAVVEEPTATITPTETLMPTETPLVTETPTETGTATLTVTPTETPSGTVTETQTPTETLVLTETATPTETTTPEGTLTPTETPTETTTPEVTLTPTETPTETPVATETPTEEPSATPTVGCDTAPAAVTLSGPEDNAKLTTKRALLQWTPSDCAESYSVVVRRVSDNDLVWRKDDLTKTQVRTDALDDGRYTWIVTAVNAFGKTQSETGKFRINTKSSLHDAPGELQVEAFSAPVDPDSFKQADFLAKATKTPRPTRKRTRVPKATRTALPRATDVPTATAEPSEEPTATMVPTAGPGAAEGLDNALASQLLIYNPDQSGLARVTVEVYDVDGQQVLSKTIRLKVNAQKVVKLPKTIGIDFVGSARISANRRIQALVVQDNDTGTKSDIYPAVETATTNVTLPLVRHAQAGQNTLLALQNASTLNPANATLTGYDESGNVVLSEPVTIAPRGVAYLNTDDLFPAGTFEGSAQVTSDQPLAVAQMVMFTNEFALLRGLQQGDKSDTLLIPGVQHMLNRKGMLRWNEIVIRNDGAAPADLTVQYRKNDGKPVGTITRSGVPAGGQVTLDSRSVELKFLGRSFEGYAQVKSGNATLAVNLISSFAKDKQITGVEAVPVVGNTRRLICGDAESNKNVNSFLNLVNRNPRKQAVLTLRFYARDNARLVLEDTIRIPAGSQITYAMPKALRNASKNGFAGLLQIRATAKSSQKIAAVMQRQELNAKGKPRSAGAYVCR